MDLHPRPTCAGCGRTFGQYSALTNHQRSCKTTNKRASDALNKFQELLEKRKKRRLDDSGLANAAQLHPSPELDVTELIPQTIRFGGLGLREVHEVWLDIAEEQLIVIYSPRQHQKTLTIPRTKRVSRELGLSWCVFALKFQSGTSPYACFDVSKNNEVS